MSKNFEIHIIPNTLGSRIRKIKFYDAHLIHWNNNFAAIDEDPVSETLTISAAGVEDSTSAGVYVASWRESFDNETTETTSIEEDEPTFIGYFFEDKDGNEIDQNKLKPNQKITMVIKTQYADWEIIELNLNDNKLDYKYDGKVAKNDIVKGINVSGDETRVELITIAQQ